MPYVMWVNDYCNDENELEPYNPEKDNTSFLKTLKKIFITRNNYVSFSFLK